MIQIEYQGVGRIECVSDLNYAREAARNFAWIHGSCDIVVDNQYRMTYFMSGSKVKYYYQGA